MNINNIPGDLTEFLEWLKQRTEEAWSRYRTATFAELQELDGFSEGEIESIEQTWQLKFPPDYRQFLRLIGVLDWPKVVAGRINEREIMQYERESFYDWRKDTDALQDAMAWPLEGLLFDVENNNLWIDSWAARPESPENRRQRLTELVREAPRLIPIFSHRYLLGAPLRAGNPVLSVWQSDIIIYGSNLRWYLLVELSYLLGLDNTEVYRQAVEEVTEGSIAAIPFWGEIILRNNRRQ